MTKVSQVDEVSEVIDSLHKTPSYVEEGIPMIRVTDIKPGSVNTENCKLVNEETYIEFSKRYVPSDGDIIITRVGSYGNVAYVVDPHFCLGQNTAAIVPKSISSRYLYYVLSSPFGRAEIENLVVGSTQKTLSLKAIKSLPVPRHGVTNEKAIAHILGTLDDKIELNCKMNETLEEIAKAIFRSWFVDFDPVRAKMEGRPTGLPDDIAALFPDRLVDSEIGQIPEGWSVSTLGDLVTPKKGKSITKKKVVEGSVPVVAGGLSPAYYHNTSNVNAPTVTISASGANAGFARLYNEDIWASDCSYISEEQTPFVFLWYVFLKIHQEKIYHMQQGAAQPHIYPSDLMRLQLAYPESDELWRCALDLIAPMFLRIGNADKESVVLSELRDTLLPKLISGELQVPDAEKFLEEAGI